MQDGASLHTGDDAVTWLNQHWKNRWIGLKSKRLQWPPKSPDLMPMDFSFWSYLKRMVAEENPETTLKLREVIENCMK